MKTKPEEAWAFKDYAAKHRERRDALATVGGSVLAMGAAAFIAMVALAGYTEWTSLAVPSKPKIDDPVPVPIADVELPAVASAPSVEKPSDVDVIRQNVSLLALEIVRRDDRIQELKRRLSECRAEQGKR